MGDHLNRLSFICCVLRPLRGKLALTDFDSFAKVEILGIFIIFLLIFCFAFALNACFFVVLLSCNGRLATAKSNPLKTMFILFSRIFFFNFVCNNRVCVAVGMESDPADSHRLSHFTHFICAAVGTCTNNKYITPISTWLIFVFSTFCSASPNTHTHTRRISNYAKSPYGSSIPSQWNIGIFVGSLLCLCSARGQCLKLMHTKWKWHCRLSLFSAVAIKYQSTASQSTFACLVWIDSNLRSPSHQGPTRFACLFAS